MKLNIITFSHVLIIAISCLAGIGIANNVTAAPATKAAPIDKDKQLIDKYITTYDALKFIKEPVVVAAITKTLPANLRAALDTNLTVGGPIGFDSGFIVISGCKAHYCDTDQAEIWYESYNKTIAIKVKVNKVSRTYINTEWQYLPASLRLLILDYQAPQKQPANVIKVAK